MHTNITHHRGCQFLHDQTPPCAHLDLKSLNILVCIHRIKYEPFTIGKVWTKFYLSRIYSYKRVRNSCKKLYIFGSCSCPRTKKKKVLSFQSVTKRKALCLRQHEFISLKILCQILLVTFPAFKVDLFPAFKVDLHKKRFFFFFFFFF